MAELQIADGLSLPLDMVVQQTAILARTGAGKTNAATVIAEELLEHGQQVVILDPPGAWWGLRASADGLAAGYPIVVIGGEHCDVSLPSDGGALLADIVVDQHLSTILDLSDLSGRQTASFVLAFATRLYERKGRERSPMLLVIEEADEVAPQRAMPDQTRMLGAIERIVKRGRMRGIGTLMISQRSASLNKNVLSQAELLIAMQTTAPQDIKAIDAWIEHHGDQEQRQQLIGAIATLAKGEAFVWSPSWLRTFERIRFRLRRTFDSSATPKPGETAAEPTVLADVDLERLRELLGAAADTEEPASGDVRDLRRANAEQRKLIEEREAYILGLETELREYRARPAAVLSPEDWQRLEALSETYRVTSAEASALGDILFNALHNLNVKPPPGAGIREVPPPKLPKAAAPAMAKAGRSKQRSASSRTSTEHLLDTLAAFELLGVNQLDRRTLAIMAGVSPRSSAYDRDLRWLRTTEFIFYPREGHVGLVENGRELALQAQTPPTLAALHAAWLARLKSAQATLLDILLEHYPEPLPRTTLATLARVSARSSAFDGNIRHLRNLGLVHYPTDGQVAATALLFPEGLR